MDHRPHRKAHESRPAIALVAVLLACGLVWGTWTAMNRTVLLTGSGAAIEPASRPDWPDMRVDINAAGAAELALLPGLGPQLAQRIVEDRQANGPFASLEALDRVPGIGPSIVERITPYAVAGGDGQSEPVLGQEP